MLRTCTCDWQCLDTEHQLDYAVHECGCFTGRQARFRVDAKVDSVYVMVLLLDLVPIIDRDANDSPMMMFLELQLVGGWSCRHRLHCLQKFIAETDLSPISSKAPAFTVQPRGLRCSRR